MRTAKSIDSPKERGRFRKIRNWDPQDPLLVAAIALFLSSSSSSMAASDIVVGNLMTIYVAVIAGIKAYGLVCERSLSVGFIVIASTTVVGLILAATLTWDVSRKATYAFARDDPHPHTHDQMCKGGICWHGVAVRSPASQIRFRLPHQIPL